MAEFQKELFKEFKKEEGKFKKIADKITQRRPRFYVNLPLENIVFLVIVTLMAIITAFALGVERGKRLLPARADEQKIPKIELKPIEAKITGKKENEAGLPYTIQLISFKGKKLAEYERKKLAKENIKAFVIPAGNWYQVCAGGYENFAEAEKALAGFRKEYKGCFVRKRR